MVRGDRRSGTAGRPGRAGRRAHHRGGPAQPARGLTRTRRGRELAGRGGCGRPAGVASPVRGDGEWVIIHRCVGCGDLGSNRAAGDDNALALTRLAVTAIRHLGSPLRIQMAVRPE
ncbi:RNHCP domain-containing protein [Micromonospora sp. NPDC006431]|uniref:RNHCP domain-containing protein n=1 Tax=Micromonospora sp. NPDC006431 TaxID=3364235 RepID=UPI0036ABE283